MLCSFFLSVVVVVLSVVRLFALSKWSQKPLKNWKSRHIIYLLANDE